MAEEKRNLNLEITINPLVFREEYPVPLKITYTHCPFDIMETV